MLYLYKIGADDAHTFIYSDCIDKYYSVVWNDRYSVCGDFELEVGSEDKKKIGLGDIILSDFSDRGMVVESISGELNDDKYIYKISGRSLESILDKRVNTRQIDEDSINPGDLIYNICAFNILGDKYNPYNGIPNLRFSKEYTMNDKITSIKTSYSSNGENLYSMVKSICDFFDMGFKIRIVADEKIVIMLIELYTGENKTIGSKEKTDKVIFSDSLGNLSNGKVTFENLNDVNLVKSIMKIEKPNEFAIEKKEDISKTLFGENSEISEPYTPASFVDTASFNSLEVNGDGNCMCYVPLVGVYDDDTCCFSCEAFEPVNTHIPSVEIFFIGDGSYTSKIFDSKNGKISGTFKVPRGTNKVIAGFSKPWPVQLPVSAHYDKIQFNHGKKLYPYKPYGKDYSVQAKIYKGSNHIIFEDMVPSIPPILGIEVREALIDVPFEKRDDFSWEKTFLTKAKEYFRSNSVDKSIEFEIDKHGKNYVYGRDYSMGDLVSVIVDNQEVHARVTEICYSEDESGVKRYPKFQIV